MRGPIFIAGSLLCLGCGGKGGPGAPTGGAGSGAEVGCGADALGGGGELEVRVAAPTGCDPSGEAISVVAAVGSRLLLQGVEARIGDRAVSLRTGPEGWTGTLAVAGLERGPARLTVTATDLEGNIASAARTVLIDRPPVITVIAPAQESVARTTLRVAASCADDDPGGCASLQVKGLPDGTSTVDGLVDLAFAEGFPVPITFEARDHAGQTTTAAVLVYVESNPHLVQVASAPGPIVDLGADRLLFVSDPPCLSGVTACAPTPRALRALRVSTGAVTTLADDSRALSAFLTPHGALDVITAEEPAGAARLVELRDRAQVDLGRCRLDSLRVTAESAIWAPFEGASELVMRDLTAGSNTHVSEASGHDAVVALGPNGDLVFGSRHDPLVYRRRGGVVTALAHSAGRCGGETARITTDGVRALVTRAWSPPYEKLCLTDESEEILLAEGEHLSSGMSGGWVAFTRKVGGVLQAFTRSPSGVVTQRSQLSESTSIEAVGPDGSVIVRTESVPIEGRAGHRYLLRGDVTSGPVDIGSASIGRAGFPEGRPAVIIGNSTFRVD